MICRARLLPITCISGTQGKKISLSSDATHCKNVYIDSICHVNAESQTRDNDGKCVSRKQKKTEHEPDEMIH